MILRRVRDAQHTEAEINSAREKYHVVPQRGSILYFVVADMPLLDPMYQYSLDYFIHIFNQCIRTAPKHRDLNTRLKMLLDNITEFVFNTVSIVHRFCPEHKAVASLLRCMLMLVVPKMACMCVYVGNVKSTVTQLLHQACIHPSTSFAK